MRYLLAPGVSFCRVGDRLLFLDVEHDKYLCLSTAAEHSVTRLVEGGTLRDDDHDALNRLEQQGLLRRGDASSGPLPCPAAPETVGSLLDVELPSATLPMLASAALQLACVSLLLKTRGLAALLAGTAKSKRRAARQSAPEAKALASVAAAFDQLSLHATAHDRCLVRSVAIARHLIRTGGRPDLVIGVKLQPFKAHCWVQHDTWLVNDRTDVVRAFTPILIV